MSLKNKALSNNTNYDHQLEPVIFNIHSNFPGEKSEMAIINFYS